MARGGRHPGTERSWVCCPEERDQNGFASALVWPSTSLPPNNTGRSGKKLSEWAIEVTAEGETANMGLSFEY